MSFFKDLFQKHKDAKYGKGHKLGTAQENETNNSNRNINPKENRPSTSQHLTQNEASKKAAEAALARQSKIIIRILGRFEIFNFRNYLFP
jgi:hypothetical protein